MQNSYEIYQIYQWLSIYPIHLQHMNIIAAFQEFQCTSGNEILDYSAKRALITGILHSKPSTYYLTLNALIKIYVLVFITTQWAEILTIWQCLSSILVREALVKKIRSCSTNGDAVFKIPLRVVAPSVVIAYSHQVEIYSNANFKFHGGN